MALRQYNLKHDRGGVVASTSTDLGSCAYLTLQLFITQAADV